MPWHDVTVLHVACPLVVFVPHKFLQKQDTKSLAHSSVRPAGSILRHWVVFLLSLTTFSLSLDGMMFFPLIPRRGFYAQHNLSSLPFGALPGGH